MNRKRENGMMLIAAIVWLAVTALAVMCCSCTTKKVVTETIYVHDTIHSFHTDTVSVERWQMKHDTIRIESERVVTLLQQDKSIPAETIRVENSTIHWEREIIRDSSERVVARVDSILKALDKQREKNISKSNPFPWQQYAAFVVVFLVGCVLVLMKKTS